MRPRAHFSVDETLKVLNLQNSLLVGTNVTVAMRINKDSYIS